MFKSGNGCFENIGYIFGAMANLSDILIGSNPQKVDLVTQHGDKDGGHSALVKHQTMTSSSEGDPNRIISVGPNLSDRRSWHWKQGTNLWETYSNKYSSIWRQSVNVNMRTITKYANWLNRLQNNGKLIYSVEISSCVTHTSIALNLSGVFNIGIFPSLLNAEMLLWSNGIRPWSYLHLLYY
jgi:hypothetical protein